MRNLTSSLEKHSDNIDSTFKGQCINGMYNNNINIYHFSHLLFGLNDKKVLNCTRI
jgi:hypothetical protein